MWKVEYTKRFLKELSELPKEIRAQAEGIVFGDLLTGNPLKDKDHYSQAHESEGEAVL